MNTRWKWILGLSLLANVFLVGGIAGGAWRWWAAERAGQATPVAQRALRSAADSLPEADRRRFVEALRAARRDAAPSVRAGRESRRELARLFSSGSDVDSQAVEATLHRTREADLAVRMRVEQAVVQFAASLTPEQRREFVHAMAQRPGPLRQAPLAPNTGAQEDPLDAPGRAKP